MKSSTPIRLLVLGLLLFVPVGLADTPSGSCTDGSVYEDAATGYRWLCESSSWVLKLSAPGDLDGDGTIDTADAGDVDGDGTAELYKDSNYVYLRETDATQDDLRIQAGDRIYLEPSGVNFGFNFFSSGSDRTFSVSGDTRMILDSQGDIDIKANTDNDAGADRIYMAARGASDANSTAILDAGTNWFVLDVDGNLTNDFAVRSDRVSLNSAGAILYGTCGASECICFDLDDDGVIESTDVCMVDAGQDADCDGTAD